VSLFPAKKQKLKRSRSSSTIELTLIAIIPLIWLIIYYYLPMGGLLVSFKQYKPALGIFRSPWNGFKNFEFFFKSDKAIRITRNTLLLNTAFIIFKIGGGLIFALILNEIRSRTMLKIYQTIMFFPFFLSWIVISYLAYSFLSGSYGFLNSWFGLDVNWYAEAQYWPIILILINTWKWLGYHAIIFYAALMGIDKTLYEAAELDGAGRFKQILVISIPQIKTVIITMTLIAVGHVFYADIGLFWNVPRNIGLLYETTQVLDTFVYNALRVTGDIGMASAAGFYQAIVGFVLIFFSNLIVRKVDADSAMF